MTVALAPSRDGDDLVTRLTLLVGQAFFLGLILGLVVVAATALLLSYFGPGALPYVYIAVAVLGSLGFYGVAEAQQRWTLVQVSVVTEAVIVVYLAVTWAGLAFAQLDWLAFAAMVSFSLILQIGFVIVGGQAGRLLDVRQIKRYFPRIVAGFVIGFMVAGAIAPPLQRMLGATENLLLVATIGALAMLGLLLAANARYHKVLAQASQTGPQVQPPPLRKTLTNRFVLLIFAYQMLSAMASQFLDYMVMASAGARFTQTDSLTNFLGTYTFALNLTDLLFLALVAGFLLTRFGLKFGLTLNPGMIVLLLVAVVVAGIFTGPASTLFFGLVILTRILDLTFTDGATRTSINAMFQALPANQRVTVQTGVEGIGVPLALGLTGVILLLFDALGNVTMVHIALFTLGISLLWTISAILVYRDYAANLLKTIGRRALGAVGLFLNDNANLTVVRRLMSSNSPTDVRLALQMLQEADHPAPADYLFPLLESDKTDIQIEALTRVEELKLDAALPLVQQIAVSHAEARVQGAAIRTQCALQEADAVAAVAPYLESPETDVALGAAVGLLRYGGVPGVLAVGEWLKVREHSDDAEDRGLVARVTGEAAITQFYHPLVALLSDPDPDVRRAALTAAGQVKHPSLLPLVVSGLSDHTTRSAASEALVAYGKLMLPIVDAALSGDEISEENTVRLVRACQQVKGDEVIALMCRHIDHASNAVRDQIFSALSACDYAAQGPELPAVNNALLREVDQGQQILMAQEEVVQDDATAPLHRALDEDLAQVRRRVFWLLSFMYDARPILRAGSQLVQGSGAEQALAFEMLDVTLSSAHKGLSLPLIDPKLTRSKRLELLKQQNSAPTLTSDERLEELIRHSDQAWIRACAIYAVGLGGANGMMPLIESSLADPNPVVRETAAWSLYTLAPDRFHQHAAALLADPDVCVARLAADLVEASSSSSQ